ncbi:hypothetical protein [Actinocorallia longicatena]|uniref:Flp pilus assembly pilin Flp n=1 Tax=Actinocorallia longicatena TaxID=111803 RepID=A0ABP6QMH0_9ACTN
MYYHLYVYSRAMLGVRLDRARDADRGLGASAIEWAIITGLLAVIAGAVYAVISVAIDTAADNAADQTGDAGNVGGGPVAP